MALRENARFMVRCEGKKRRVVEKSYLVRVLVKREPNRRVTKEKGIPKGELIILTRSATFVRRRDTFK